MTKRRPRRDIAACAVVAWVALTLTACSNDSSKQKGPVVRIMGNARTPPPAPVATDPTDPAAEGVDPPPPPPGHAEITSQVQAPKLHLTQIIRLDSGIAKVNPDLAIIDAARSSAASCFTGITDNSPSRSASIRVTVLPTGSVSRSEVSSGNTTEPDILSCLQSVGEGLHFTEKSDRLAVDLRTYSIDVTVTRTH